MLTPTRTTLTEFKDLMRSSNSYALTDVRLDIPNSSTATFRAKLNGPAGAAVWARAWLSDDAGTLAEMGSAPQMTNDEIVLEVILPKGQAPQSAYMRIESAPLKTEHVVVLKLTEVKSEQ